jgi:uncharacterized membrane protein
VSELAEATSVSQAPVWSLKSGRIVAVDVLRGTIMLVMALDHVREYLTNARFDVTDLSRTTPALFLTRWITHFCASNFVFFAGASAFLYGIRVGSRRELSRYLLTRGLWLVFLEVTVIRFGWLFDLDYKMSIFQVIWAIGISMIVLSGLVWLPRWAILSFGLAMMAGHDLLDGIRADDLGDWAPLWRILHELGAVRLGGERILFVAYPLVPWIGVMAAGYGFGAMLVEADPARRHRRLFGLGLSLCALFVAVRATNLYGDPRPWQVQATPLLTVFSFVNCSKYPPSLLFLLMTIGPAIAALPLLERLHGPLGTFLATFGRVPLFFYVLHIYLIHLVTGVAAVARYGLDGALAIANSPFDLPSDFGYGLPVVYAIWVGVVLVLYFPCRWFARLRLRHRDWWWLSYL